MNSKQAIIVGAGPAGLTAAYYLLNIEEYQFLQSQKKSKVFKNMFVLNETNCNKCNKM